MALGHTFYHASIRKMVIVFGNLFNDIYVRRFDSAGAEIERRKVPISYGPKQKFLARLDAGQFDQETAITLPRMAFEMDTMTYDAERKISSSQRLSNQKAGESVKYTFAPVPYTFDFTLSIMTKNAEDGTQILEQILPYFTPHFNVTIKEFPELEITRDIPIILNSLQQEDVYDGDFETRRSLIWSLSFTMKSNIYGAVREGQLVSSAVVSTIGENQFSDGQFKGATVTSAADDPVNGLTTGDFGFTQSVVGGAAP
jgi:hypothetical protein